MPADPKRLLIIDRVVVVLRAIKAGDLFFYTPYEVVKGFISSPTGFPIYMVLSETGGEMTMNLDQQYEETFYVSVRGIVQSNDDVVTPLERAIRDIRKAINDDFKPEAGAGSLITLASEMRIDGPPEIDYGFEGTHFFGYFTQRVRLGLYGEIGEI